MKKKKRTFKRSWGMAILLLFLVSLVIALTSIYMADCLFELSLNREYIDYLSIQKQEESGTGQEDDEKMEAGQEDNEKMEAGKEHKDEMDTEQKNGGLGTELEYNDGIYGVNVRYVSKKGRYGNLREVLKGGDGCG